jgi:hypothetical protein
MFIEKSLLLALIQKSIVSWWLSTGNKLNQHRTAFGTNDWAIKFGVHVNVDALLAAETNWIDKGVYKKLKVTWKADPDRFWWDEREKPQVFVIYLNLIEQLFDCFKVLMKFRVFGYEGAFILSATSTKTGLN